MLRCPLYLLNVCEEREVFPVSKNYDKKSKSRNNDHVIVLFLFPYIAIYLSVKKRPPLFVFEEESPDGIDV